MTILISRVLLVAASIIALATSAFANCAGTNILPRIANSHPEIFKQVREAANKIPNTEAIFWRIKKNGSAPSHLFGTMHVSDERITTLSGPARAALEASKIVALEIADMSPAAMMQAIARVPQLMVYVDGSRLDQKLSAPEFELVSEELTRAGMPSPMAPMVRPWMVSIMLAVPLCEQQRTASGRPALDPMIASLAKIKNTPVIGLETIDSQLKAMATVPEEDQLALLRTSLAYLKDRDDLFETLIQSYLKRDLGIVLTLSEAMAKMAKLKSSGFANFSNELIKKRNQTMFDSSRPLVDKGNAFIAVGAAHLIGDTGLVASFRKAGFTVTAIN